MGESKRKSELGLTPKPEERTVFALSGDKRTCVIGVPNAAWEFMKNGKTHHFDLQRLGFPVRIILFGGPTRGHILDAINPLMKGQPASYNMQEDFGIKPDERAVTGLRKRVRERIPETVQWNDTELDELLHYIMTGEKSNG